MKMTFIFSKMQIYYARDKFFHIHYVDNFSEKKMNLPC